MTIFSLPRFSYTPPPPPLLHTLGARVGVRPPPPQGAFLQLFSMWEPYCYVFLLIGNLFDHVGAFLVHFSPHGKLFFTMWGSFFSIRVFLSLYRAFRHFLHVGAFWLRFHPYWDLFLPCGGLFVTFFFLLGTCFTMWWHYNDYCFFISPFGGLFCTYGGCFCTYGGLGLFCTYGGHFGLPPPVRIFLRAPVYPLPPHTIHSSLLHKRAYL